MVGVVESGVIVELVSLLPLLVLVMVFGDRGGVRDRDLEDMAQQQRAQIAAARDFRSFSMRLSVEVPGAVPVFKGF